MEIRVEPQQLEKLKADARRRKIPIGEIIREVIDQKYAVTREEKIKEAQKMFKLELPIKNWDEMKGEIEEGYRK